MPSEIDDLAFRESVFAWLRLRQLTQPVFTRDQLANFEFQGKQHRLVGTQTGIWRVKEFSPAAISILTAYSTSEKRRPYEDEVGDDGMLRYKWRGDNANTADNVWLRTAMERRLPLVWFVGVGFLPNSKAQVFQPTFPVWLIDEEPSRQQFVVAVDEAQRRLDNNAVADVIEIAKKYNERVVKTRYHQPLFRTAVLYAYEQRCAVCSLPFRELLDAAHIQPDSEGGAARVSNGLALCKIHHGAFDANLIGISPDYVVHVKESVLATFDGPTLQHAIKEMDQQRLRTIPHAQHDRPSRDLLDARFEVFKTAS